MDFPAPRVCDTLRHMSVEVCVRELVKNYGEVQALRGVNLDVTAGEIFGLLGPNGAGKTTTIECILGLRQPESGSITVSGIDALAHRRQIKMIIGAQLQATALQDKITPREALKFFGAFYRNAIKPSELIERFSLSEKADAPFDSLSGGQKQRLALALAFVNDPKLIFLDEPTAGLDPESRRDLHDDILKLKAEGRTIVLSTHYMEEAQRLCDHIGIINAGRIVALGTPGEMIGRTKMLDRVVIKTEPMLAFENMSADGSIETDDVGGLVIRLVKRIDAEGVKLIDLKIRRASLEDSYLKLIEESKC